MSIRFKVASGQSRGFFLLLLKECKMSKFEIMLRRVRLELARDHDFPDGSSARGYEFIAPLDRQGHIELAAWKGLRERCRVRRFWGHEREEVGHVLHKRGNVWAFHYDIHGDPNHDEAGFKFERHTFVPGEYVSLKEQDGAQRTFRVVSVREMN
jgi:hypothetical protein